MKKANGNVLIKFMPTIYKDEYLNNASQCIGAKECYVSGKTEQLLFENIEEKIWAMSSEAIIINDEIAKKYNQWRSTVPEYIENMGQRDMRFALPYSEKFKQWLRKNN